MTSLVPTFVATSVSWYVWSPIVLGLATIGIVLLLGIHPLRSGTTSSAISTEVISHTVGSLTLFVGMYALVPKYRAIFEDFGVELPGISVLLIRASDTAVKYSYLVALLLVALIAADAAIFRMLHKNESTRTSARIWSGCITALIGITILFSTVAIVGPSMALPNELP